MWDTSKSSNPDNNTGLDGIIYKKYSSEIKHEQKTSCLDSKDCLDESVIDNDVLFSRQFYLHEIVSTAGCSEPSNGVFRICFIFYFLPVRLRERDLLIILGEIRERLTRRASRY